MTPMRLRLCFLVTGSLVFSAVPALAQLPAARLNSIFPAGARQGTTVECTIAGADLEGLSGLDFSHPGITAEAAGTNAFKVCVAADVPVGPYDARAVTPRGLSNFRTFHVGDIAEAVDKEPNDSPENAQTLTTIPVVVNGRVNKQTDVDFFKFSATKGQRVFIDCWASRLDSQLDGTLMVYDSTGKELGYSGDDSGKDPFLDFTAPADGDYLVKLWDFVYAGSADHFYRLHIGSLPHLDAVLPASIRPGETTTLTLIGRNLPGGTPAPGLTDALGHPLETITRDYSPPVDLARPDLLRGGEAIRPPQAMLDGLAYRLTSPEGSSNPLFLGLAEDPVVLEVEPNNDLASAQRVEFPCEITGTFAPSGDVDFYKFAVKKSDKLIVEAIGERQTGQIDPFLAAFDPAGKKIFSGDDVGSRNIGQLRFTTNSRDPRWEFTAPADAEYTVQVRDLYFQQRGEPRFRYRLSIRSPRPDFRLLAVPTHDIQPDSTTVGRDGRGWLDVLAYRADGFDDPIRIEASGLPEGVTCEPVVIGPGKTSTPLVFRASADAPIGHERITITGRATIEGREVSRVARGGGLTWPTVNTPGVARLADGVTLAIRAAPPFVIEATVASNEALAGAKVPISVSLRRADDWKGAVQLSGFDLPNNASIPLVNVADGKTEAKLELTLPANLKPGPYTFTINGAGQVPRNYLAVPDPKQPRGNNLRAVFPSNPITLTISTGAKK